MNKNTYIVSALILIAAAFGYIMYTNTSLLDPLKGTMQHHTSQTHESHTNTATTTATGISERQYIEHMIPHHQEAIDTAKQVVARGKNTDVKTLAESIIIAQEKEISDMKAWYQSWYGVEYKDTGVYEPMMRDLVPLSGDTLDRAFIEDMIPHHTHALMMNQQVVPNIEHEEIKALATAIAETQSAEIITMRILLKQL